MKSLTLGKDKKIMGVCAGLADYFSVDVTVLRIAMLALIFFTGIFPGVLFYFIAGIVMPEPSKGEVDGV